MTWAVKSVLRSGLWVGTARNVCLLACWKRCSGTTEHPAVFGSFLIYVFFAYYFKTGVGSSSIHILNIFHPALLFLPFILLTVAEGWSPSQQQLARLPYNLDLSPVHLWAFKDFRLKNNDIFQQGTFPEWMNERMSERNLTCCVYTSI